MSQTAQAPAENSQYLPETLYYRAVDPIHVGAGGYRLGRVDNTICREPGTHVPKIPGTSLAGAARAYASLLYGKPEAAGQHRNWRGQKKQCPILFTFGTATSTDGGQAGKVSFGDAQILLFPVASNQGPVWISTARLLNDRFHCQLPPPPDRETLQLGTGLQPQPTSLGWLLFPKHAALGAAPDWVKKETGNRLVIVDESLFAQVVNSCLEVRTSVSINPATGAAAEGALFTYEAIPRDTYFVSDLVVEPGANLPVSITGKYQPPGFNEEGEAIHEAENAGDPLNETWRTAADVAKAGLALMNPLGIGGMGTRGFGRLALLRSPGSNGGANA